MVGDRMGYLNVVKDPVYGSYRAFVEDNVDPLNLGRFRVRVPFLHGTKEEVKTEDLPWAIYCAPGLSYNSGVVITPSIGDVVMVVFEGGDVNRPVYLGSILSKGSSSFKTFEEYEGSSVIREPHVDDMPEDKRQTSQLLYKSPRGNMILIEDKEGEESITIKDARGSKIVLEGGVVTIDSSSTVIKSNLYIYGDLDVSGETNTYNINNTNKIITKTIIKEVDK